MVVGSIIHRQDQRLADDEAHPFEATDRRRTIAKRF